MPNIGDIIEVAQALESKPVLVVSDRCVVVRNRNASCRRCQDSCPVDAITIERNTISLDTGTCVACGACTVVCPTETLVPLRPLDIELAQSIADACENTEGQAVFACARIASKRIADPLHYAEVPCLARMEESLLIQLVERGISDIKLIDGTCRTCIYHDCNHGIDETVQSVNDLLATVGSSVLIERHSEFPSKLTLEDRSGFYGESRRSFFTSTGGRAKDAAEKTVLTMLKSSNNATIASLKDMLGITEKGTLPQFEAKRRMDILDAMDSLGGPVVPELETRLWGSVEIDTELCTSCHICAVFCPTGALKKVESYQDGQRNLGLEFSLADCVQCMACTDVCLSHCIKVESRISTEELFDFEPRYIGLPKPPTKVDFLGKKKP